MKNEYQKMMGQVSLSDSARTDILEQLEQGKPAKRKARPLRVVLIAACICLALVGGAFAGGVLPHVRVAELFGDGYELNFDGVICWTSEEVGQQMLHDLQVSDGSVRREFGNWNELKEYVGLSLANHPLLDCADRHSLDVKGDGTDVIYGTIHRIAVVEGITVRSDILFWGEEGQPDTHVFSGVYSGETEVEAEGLRLSNGTEALLVQVNSNGVWCWDVFFVYEGNLYFLNFRDSFGENDVEKGFIEKILNDFEF